MNFRQLMQIVEREVGAETAARVAVAICQSDAQGQRIYIPERPGPPEIRPGDTPRAIMMRYPVSRSTARSWVRRYSM